MDDQQFEQQITKTVPKSVLAQLWHMVRPVPEKYRMWFLNLLKGGIDMTQALLVVANPTHRRTVKEYIHCRMQDNMSEIMD